MNVVRSIVQSGLYLSVLLQTSLGDGVGLPKVFAEKRSVVLQRLRGAFEQTGERSGLVFRPKVVPETGLSLIRMHFLRAKCEYVNYQFLGNTADDIVMKNLHDLASEIAWVTDSESRWARTFARAWTTKDRSRFAYFNDRRRGDPLLAHQVVRAQEPLGLTVCSKDYLAAVEKMRSEIERRRDWSYDKQTKETWKKVPR